VNRPLGLDPEDPLVKQAVFGVEVQDFLRSPIGDFLLKRAENRLEVLIGQLKKQDPSESSKILALQAEIRHLEMFEGWLAEAVQAGITAVAIIDGEIDAEDA
jgi:hypothetical protein